MNSENHHHGNQGQHQCDIRPPFVPHLMPGDQSLTKIQEDPEARHMLEGHHGRDIMDKRVSKGDIAKEFDALDNYILKTTE